ncbi:MAG: hypothetical protein A2Z14_18760 [Chloroflexi bacterium RBG_16_48_8]|nr:MAG: hypothetical protein A2Z14_18760 [Chloroflexi bacterium RBG_16_48_8]
MWMSFWLENLQQTLNRLHLNNPSPRIAIVGIGHELRGDDSVGLFIVRRLASSLQEDESLLIVDAGSAPENCTHLLRGFSPDLVILIDAAEMEKSPGSIEWIPWHDSIGLSASTHSLPLHIFAQYLIKELNCEVALLGIQPMNINFDVELDPAVRASAERAVLDVILLLSNRLGHRTKIEGNDLINEKSSKTSIRQKPYQEHIPS